MGRFDDMGEAPLPTIKKLPQHRGVKLSSTLSGQRELIREMRNAINKIIEYLNNDR